MSETVSPDISRSKAATLSSGDENSTGEGDTRMVSMGLAYRF
jgi:hypothetical protein